MYDTITPGARVTITDRFGEQRRGRAIFRGTGGWVLNMGGKHGIPAIATRDNVVRVTAPRNDNFTQQARIIDGAGPTGGALDG